jgi:hypothetical protein
MRKVRRHRHAGCRTNAFLARSLRSWNPCWLSTEEFSYTSPTTWASAQEWLEFSAGTRQLRAANHSCSKERELPNATHSLEPRKKASIDSSFHSKSIGHHSIIPTQPYFQSYSKLNGSKSSQRYSRLCREPTSFISNSALCPSKTSTQHQTYHHTLSTITQACHEAATYADPQASRSSATTVGFTSKHLRYVIAR